MRNSIRWLCIPIILCAVGATAYFVVKRSHIAIKPPIPALTVASQFHIEYTKQKSTLSLYQCGSSPYGINWNMKGMKIYGCDDLCIDTDLLHTLEGGALSDYGVRSCDIRSDVNAPIGMLYIKNDEIISMLYVDEITKNIFNSDIVNSYTYDYHILSSPVRIKEYKYTLANNEYIIPEFNHNIILISSDENVLSNYVFQNWIPGYAKLRDEYRSYIIYTVQ